MKNFVELELEEYEEIDRKKCKHCGCWFWIRYLKQEFCSEKCALAEKSKELSFV